MARARTAISTASDSASSQPKEKNVPQSSEEAGSVVVRVSGTAGVATKETTAPPRVRRNILESVLGGEPHEYEVDA
jgi:hypothetical protein